MEDEVRRYYDKKIRCPRCNRKIIETFLTPPKYIPNKEYRDRVNIVMCSECGWRGFVDELKG